MNHIAITHNPFLVETEFLINGNVPSESSNITAYGSKRLQLWVEQIFDDLQALFNGSKDFFIEFTGVESDFNDIKEAANNAIPKGMHVELKFNPVAPAEERLENQIPDDDVSAKSHQSLPTISRIATKKPSKTSKTR